MRVVLMAAGIVVAAALGALLAEVLNTKEPGKAPSVVRDPDDVGEGYYSDSLRPDVVLIPVDAGFWPTIPAAAVEPSFGWRPLCPGNGRVADFEVNHGLQRISIGDALGGRIRFVQQPGRTNLVFMPEPVTIDTINGFVVEFAAWTDIVNARFRTGEERNGEPIYAGVTARNGDMDEVRRFIESLTFDCQE